MSLTQRRGVQAGLLFLLLAAFVTALVAWLSPGSAVSQGGGNTGYERVYAANFTTYGSPPELVTNLPPADGGDGGLLIYNKDFFAADDVNTLFVQVSATGDTHGGARLQLSCKVDGQPCNAGDNPVGGSPSGWVTLSRHDNYNDNYTGPGYGGDGGGGAGDVHDNAIMKEWCTPFEVKAGTHNVQVRMASSPAPGDPGSAGEAVFMEAVDFKVTGARIADPSGRCTRDVLASGTPAGAAASAAADSQRKAHGHDK